MEGEAATKRVCHAREEHNFHRPWAFEVHLHGMARLGEPGCSAEVSKDTHTAGPASSGKADPSPEFSRIARHHFWRKWVGLSVEGAGPRREGSH